MGRREQIGAVGNNNGMYSAHLHFEIRTANLSADFWPSGYSRDWVAGRYTHPTDFVDGHRSLCTAATVSWTSTPPQNVWYNTDRQLVYSTAGTGPVTVTESPSGAVGDGVIWLSQGGQGGLRDYTVTVSNACGSDSKTWHGGYDTVAPSTNFSGPATSTWLPGGSAVAWNPTDGTSNIATSSLIWDNGSTTVQVPEGTHSVTVTATDNAGNNVTEIHAPYWLDTIAPAVSLSGPASSTWLRTPQQVVWGATDATSGIATKTLTWDIGGATSTSPAQIPEGKRTATVTATDSAAHQASQVFGPWWIDTTPPVVSTAFNPTSPTGENGWFITYPTISFSATDPNGADGSGVSSLSYVIDGGSQMPYTAPIPISTDGIHSYRATATDVAGNAGTTGDQIVKVDTSAPVFDAVYTDAEARSLDTLVAAWSCSDQDSGIAEYEYWIGTTAGDNNVRPATVTVNNWAYAMNLSLTNGQTYYFTIRAKNAAGLWNTPVSSQGILAAEGTRDVGPLLDSGGVSVPDQARTSTNYRMVDSIGQFVVDSSSSANYQVEHGYWHSDISFLQAASPGLAKAQANGVTLQIGTTDNPLVVTSSTSTFADRFYLEQTDKSSGIAVQYGAAGGRTLVEGDQVTVIGKMNTIAGERTLQFASPQWVGHTDPLNPLFVTVPCLGGWDLNQYTPGVLGGKGLNNIGLLVTTFGGLVSYRDSQGRFFYVDNGDGLYDGYSYGVRIICDGFLGGGKLAMPAYGKNVMVTGISSTTVINGHVVRAIRPRRQSDILWF